MGAPGLWRALALSCSNHEIAWVPAHGKHADWTPREAPAQAAQWRELNARADAQAQEVCQQAIDNLRPWVQGFESAVAWSIAALTRQKEALRLLHTHVLNQTEVSG